MAILVNTQIRNDLYATGSITAGGGFTGSLSGDASSINGANIIYTNSLIPAINVIYSLYQLNTSSYDGVFFDYTAKSGSNKRIGTIFGGWIGNTITYTNITSSDIGDVSQLTMSLGLLTDGILQLSGSVSINPTWIIKIMGRWI